MEEDYTDFWETAKTYKYSRGKKKHENQEEQDEKKKPEVKISEMNFPALAHVTKQTLTQEKNMLSLFEELSEQEEETEPVKHVVYLPRFGKQPQVIIDDTLFQSERIHSVERAKKENVTSIHVTYGSGFTVSKLVNVKHKYLDHQTQIVCDQEEFLKRPSYMRHLTYDDWLEIMDSEYDPRNSTTHEYLPSFMEKTQTEQTRHDHDDESVISDMSETDAANYTENVISDTD